MFSEADNIKLIRQEASNYGAVLWRNNSGAFKDAKGRLIRFGLANDSAVHNKKKKSSDLIGLAPDGRFLAVECKKSGWKYTGTEEERAQKEYLDFVNERGGIAFFCSNSKKFVDIFKKLGHDHSYYDEDNNLVYRLRKV
jgi:hypothetical protein